MTMEHYDPASTRSALARSEGARVLVLSLASILIASLLGAFILNGAAQEVNNQRIFEAYPAEIRARLDQREQFLKKAAPKRIAGFSVESVILRTARWTPGHVITVAFSGGDSALHKDIVSVASGWTNYGNVFFDFGYDPVTGRCREWRTGARQYEAEVRVSFNRLGYWSYVGNASIDPTVVAAFEPSLNLEGFDLKRPDYWRATVLHEFGHALGFEHEHQNPTGGCDREFRWSDDPGYTGTTNNSGGYIIDFRGKRPGIYTVLGGPPNNWDKDKVDQNLRKFPDSRAFIVGPFDVKSIMKYSFEEWMFVRGAQSSCFSLQSTNISSGDANGMAAAYPRDPVDINVVISQRTTLLNSVLALPKLPYKAKASFEQQLLQLGHD